MDPADVVKVDRSSWRRTLFYIDLAVFAVLALAILLAVRHSFSAGQSYSEGDFSSSTDALWLVVGDTAFLVGALGWVLYRFFRNQAIVMTRRY